MSGAALRGESEAHDIDYRDLHDCPRAELELTSDSSGSLWLSRPKTWPTFLAAKDHEIFTRETNVHKLRVLTFPSRSQNNPTDLRHAKKVCSFFGAHSLMTSCKVSSSPSFLAFSGSWFLVISVSSVLLYQIPLKQFPFFCYIRFCFIRFRYINFLFLVISVSVIS